MTNFIQLDAFSQNWCFEIKAKYVELLGFWISVGPISA